MSFNHTSKPLLFLMTLGCPKNQADSRQIRGMLLEKDYRFTSAPQEAEIILLNTCGFVDEAKEESINTALELAVWKQRGRCRRLIMLGCLVQKYGGELAAALPEVDLFLGVADWPKLPELLAVDRAGAAGEPVPVSRLLAGAPAGQVYCREWELAAGSEVTGYVKIAEGCGHRCAFCVIPQIRGPYRSRQTEDIVAEAEARVAGGLREAILIAQDTGAYGRDLAPKQNLAGLIRRLCAIKDLARIRVMYCYPEAVDDELIASLTHPKVCPYLDMPIQHVADGVLRRMGRPVSGARLKEVIRGLRERVPDMVIRTTLMVGFPGESEADFQALLDFLEEYRLERVGFFAFSPQPDTPAAAMDGQIPQAEKERRLALAQEKQSRILAAWHAALIGRVLEVLVDERSGDSAGGFFYEGRSRFDAPEIDGLVSFASPGQLEPGDLVRVRITHSQDHILSGEIEDEPGQ